MTGKERKAAGQRAGGMKTKRLYGNDFYVEIGRMSVVKRDPDEFDAARARGGAATLARHGRDHFRKMARARHKQ